MLASALALVAGCSNDETVRSGAGQRDSVAAVSDDCSYPSVDGPVIDTLADFVDQAEVVALVELGETTAIESTRLPDFESERLVAEARVVEAAKGAEAGEVIDLFYAVRSTDPTRPELEPTLQGPEAHEFTAGDRLVVALGATSEAGERELLAPHAFFVDVDGRLDPELAETRSSCTERPLFVDAEGMTTDELLGAARAEAETAG